MENGLASNPGSGTLPDENTRRQNPSISRTRSRGWCFTWNNYPEEFNVSLDKLPVEYICWGKETAPSTGTPHLQGYLYFSNARTFSSIQRKLPGVHLLPARGTGNENKVYCSKGGDFSERGICPGDDVSGGDVERGRWDHALAMAKSGELEAIPSDIVIR